MNDVLQRILANVLGATVGLVIGVGLLFLNLPLFDQMKPLVLLNSAIIGALVSVIIVEYKKESVLRKSNKVRIETVALITHEMRTGLTSTGWAINFIITNYGKVLNTQDKAMLEGVVGSIRGIIEHSVNLLDISLTDIKKLSITLDILPLSTVESMLKESVSKYILGAERKGVKLMSNISLDQSRKIEVDIVRLRIILENLLDNALQYTVSGEKRITVDASNDSKSLHLKVSDTGIGIPTAEYGNIFGEFFRASNARKQLVSGSGIGLYMTDQYVKAHHGKISFKSEEGKGTTFFVEIPLATSADVNEFLDKV